VRAERCVVRWDEAQTARALTRLRAAARAAAEQSRRARLPGIEAPVDIAALAGRAGVVVAERGGAPSDAIAPPKGPDDEWTVLVGPEGGFAPGERARLGNMPHLGLGPHVLKAETAPIAAVAILIESAGRLCRE
jgi:16S rRNA (uracil1498-N3)-methyltransferase